MRFLPAIAILLPLAAVGEPAFDRTAIRFFQQADGTQSPSERPMSFQFFEGKSESHSANLLWNSAADQDWSPGSYEVECLAGETSLAKAAFEVALNPPEVADGEIRVEAVRVFPVGENLPPRMLRKYTALLAAETTTRIGIELEFSHAAPGRSAKVPVECYFFWPDGQTSPPVILSYESEPTWAGGFSAGAMGWERSGNWPKGFYTISCAIYGQPVIIDRFDLT